ATTRPHKAPAGPTTVLSSGFGPLGVIVAPTSGGSVAVEPALDRFATCNRALGSCRQGGLNLPGAGLLAVGRRWPVHGLPRAAVVLIPLTGLVALVHVAIFTAKEVPGGRLSGEALAIAASNGDGLSAFGSLNASDRAVTIRIRC